MNGMCEVRAQCLGRIWVKRKVASSKFFDPVIVWLLVYMAKAALTSHSCREKHKTSGIHAYIVDQGISILRFEMFGDFCADHQVRALQTVENRQVNQLNMRDDLGRRIFKRKT
jgi:hypothetical protein